MANTHSTLASLFTDIAKAIRSKTGSSASIVADQFPDAIAAIDTQENLDAELSAQDSLIAQINTALVGKAGVVLPTLSNPAGAGNIEVGYQAIDGAGKMIEGTVTIGDKQLKKSGAYFNLVGGVNLPTYAQAHETDSKSLKNAVAGHVYVLVYNGVVIGTCTASSSTMGYVAFTSPFGTATVAQYSQIEFYELV